MYEISYQKHAARQILRLHGDIARRISAKVEMVAADPYGNHPNAMRMRGRNGGFRLRVGDWRVLYFLDKERKRLLVTKIDRRGTVYR